MIDLFDGLETLDVRVLDHGFVCLVDMLPRLVEPGQTADHAVVQAARVSYGSGLKTPQEDRGLIRYMMRHRHSTPFESVSWKFHVKLPIFVARQWIRHRTGSFNELSGRYSVLQDEFYVPDPADLRRQSTANKQGGDEPVPVEVADEFCGTLLRQADTAYARYERYLEQGVSREQARIGLPLNLFTEWYWSVDLHNLLHFLSLRADPHAQGEMQVYAHALLDLITPLVPWTIEAWNDFHPTRGAITLTRPEVEALRHALVNQEAPPLEGTAVTGRERREWQDKARALGLQWPQGVTP